MGSGEGRTMIDERWEVQFDRKLGEGGFGSVFLGRDTRDAVDCAAKKVRLSDTRDREAFKSEHQVLMRVHDHASIISVLGDATTEFDAYLFLELATGGELFDRLEQGVLSEGAAWPYFKAMTLAVEHCHSRGIAHRDLKLENVMLVADDPHAIRLIDFGLAVQLRLTPDGQIDPTDRRQDIVGTKSYGAPEMLTRNYDATKIDIWSLGIVLFTLCAGFFPLEEAKLDSDWRFRKLVAEQQAGGGSCEAIFRMYQRACPFSEPLKDLIDAMLRIDPDARPGITVIAAHPWLLSVPAPLPVYRGSYRSLGATNNNASPPDGAPPIERQRARRLA